MQMAMVAAGFSPEQADQLRRAIAAWKSRTNVIFEMGDQLIRGMIERGYDKDYAQRLFKQIQGFSEYGFPESHAASFALIVYASAWLKHHHPAAFAAGLINSQPMGFYAPAQIIRDARDHGVTVRPIDINHSDWDCTLEPSEPGPAEDHDKAVPLPADASRDQARPAIRLGMRLIKGLAEQQARQLVALRRRLGSFTRLDQLRSGTGLRAATLKRLAEADAFNSLALDRQQALWAIEAMTDQPMPLFDQAAASSPADDVSDAVAYLPAIPAPRRVVQDYAHTGLSLKDHPLKFMRPKLAAMGAIANEQLADAQGWPQGRIARVAGIVLVRQRPSTASGVVFVTLEDETGIANLILRPPIFQRFRRIARHATIMLAQGRVERQGRVIHILAERLIDLSAEAGRLARMSRDFH
jgi:error-prone DNA polymerase